MEITKEEFAAANERAEQTKTESPVAVSVVYDRRIHRIVIALSSGLEIAFSPKNVEGLDTGHPDDFSDIQISPSGLGIYVPKLDADIYIPSLLQGFFGSRNWMAAQMGKKGGSMTSTAKSVASRNNGKLGGRPRKAA